MSTYFLSDSHLGAGSDSLLRERQLVAFLHSIEPDCERLVLLGDIFEFWFSYRHVVPKGHVRLLGALAEMVDRGVEVHYFIGNHDMWIFDYLEKEIGIIMHSEACDMVLNGKRFRMGHGDGEGHKLTRNKHEKHYIHLKRIFRCRFNQRLFGLVNPLIGMSIALRWSDNSRQSHGDKFNHYLGDAYEGIVIHAQECLSHQDYDYFVFGHRHLAMTKEIIHSDRKALYVNVGDWIDHRDYARFDGTCLTLHQYYPSPTP